MVSVCMKKSIFWITLVFVIVLFSQKAMAHPPELHEEKPVAAQSQSQEQTSEDDGHDHQAVGETEGHDHDESAETEEHSHWGLSPDSTPMAKSMAAIGKYHLLVVHFPIALIMTAALAQALYLSRRKESYQETVRFLVWTGLFAVVAAGLLGWAHSGPPQHSEAPVMFSHRWIGSALFLGAVLTTFFMEKSRSQGSSIWSLLFNFSLFSLALIVAINGFLGGALAHGGIKHLMPGMM